MSAPRTKRQFAGAAADPSQRQITSFFPSSRSSPDVAPVSYAAPQPALPATVQSNLLSVGMRVRKSVPEGYKTGTMSAFKLWSDNTPVPAPMSTVSMPKASARELAPFCGINRVGGLDVQHMDDDDVPSLDALPELTMSQESTDSNVSSEPSRKRGLVDDDAEAEERLWDGEPSTYNLPHNRVMAVPRSRTKSKHAHGTMPVDNDFDDADFLVFSDNAEMDTSG
jgi:hypothetical protein